MRKPLVFFLWEDEDDDGTPCGPASIQYFEGPSDEPIREEKLEGWFTIHEAHRLAEQREFGFRL